jgi:hypothetical protein
MGLASRDKWSDALQGSVMVKFGRRDRATYSAFQPPQSVMDLVDRFGENEECMETMPLVAHFEATLLMMTNRVQMGKSMDTVTQLE